MADTTAIQDEIAQIEKKITELQAQLQDAKSRLEKSQADAIAHDAAANMSAEEKMALIKVNLQEVLNPEIMDAAMKDSGSLKIYWGTATTGRPHCGYVRVHPESRLVVDIYVCVCCADGSIVCTHPQDCAIPRCRLSRQDPAR